MGQGVTLIPLVRILIIYVWLGFLSKIWILVFLGKYSNIFVGFQSVSIEVRIIWYQSTGSKISFLSLLSFVSCYHPILFLLCSLFLILILWRALGQNCAPSSKKKKNNNNNNMKKKTWKKKKKMVIIENIVEDSIEVKYEDKSTTHNPQVSGRWLYNMLIFLK